MFDLLFSVDGDRLLSVALSVRDQAGSATYFEITTQFQLVNVDETDGILLAGDTSDLNGDGLVDGLVLGFDNS
jgi:hypothetical protein